MAAAGTPGCQGFLQHSCPAGIRGAGTEECWVQGQTQALPMLGVGDTDVSRAGAHPLTLKYGHSLG